MNDDAVFGRLRVVRELSAEVNVFSLNIGCKETHFGNINVDIDSIVKPDVAADVLNLPFKDDTFDRVYFTDVIEHLPKNTESPALVEIYRVLRKSGILILTTPNDNPVYTWLDPAKYVVGHRHYKVESIQKMTEDAGFKIEKIFTAGDFWEMISILWYCFITYPIKRILGINLPYVPKFLLNRVDREYNGIRKKEGYTIFVKMRKLR